ncbi:AMP-dependent synthetase/ligase [Melia azedarach]|uniref:AMP-dependent synthetase/ligase n=1 Tax=Melia azedarach TaxID=155640 RepID=A0ACC1WP79_MELAZ|nr:AMP-dependent synthetase/ligase [Melia azedarach]
MDQLKPKPGNSFPLTPLGFLERAATVYGDCSSVVYDNITYTWSQTYRRCLQLASSLSSVGIETGHVVSIVAPNIPAMYELHFAVPMSGAILNTINTRLDARTISVLLQHSESKLVFVDHLVSALIIEAISLFPTHTKTPRLVVVTDHDDGVKTLDFIDTYENMVRNAMAAVGATNIFLRKIDVPTIYSLIREHGVTHMCGAPVVLNMLSKFPQAEPLDRPVHILTAGAPPPAPVLLRTESLGFIVSHGYGLTETAGVVVSCAWKPHWNMLPATEKARLKARQGVRTIGFTEVDVVDPKTGLGVKRDGLTRGEIVMRGGCVMLGYLKDEESTSKCMRDGWFYSGDVAVLHPDGYIDIKDRSKDVIISGGENISSAEVESILYSHPLIDEAAVVARPDPLWQETPCAFVCLKKELTQKPSEKDIIEYCRGRLPHYMVPKAVVFKQELPKTATGKVQKFVLRDIAKSMLHSRM